MKKRLMTILLTLIATLCLAFAFAACDSGNSGNSGNSSDGGNRGGEQGAPQNPDEDDIQSPDDGGEQKPSHVHAFTVDNTCSICGDKWEYTEGLSYKLDPETDTYAVAKNETASGDIVIPYGYQGKWVTSVGEYAFAHCKDLMSIVLPESVIAIEDCAFEFCYSLDNIVLPNTLIKIGYKAFDMCMSLTRIEIPSSVTFIARYAFTNCAKLIEVYNFSDLDIAIGEETNGEVALYAKKIYTTYEESRITTSDDDFLFYEDENECYLLGYCGDRTELTLPQKSTNGKEYKIYQYAFGGKENINSIIVPDGRTEIEEYAFFGCFGLKSIKFGHDVASIGDYAFGRSGLTSIRLPDSVRTIGDHAFYLCTSLRSVEIPDSVTLIGHEVFANCYQLTSVIIGKNATFSSIGDAFWGCNGLKIYYKGTPSEWSGIQIGSYNSSLTGATRYYFSAQAPSAEQWQESENWWHYDADDETIVLWTKES